MCVSLERRARREVLICQLQKQIFDAVVAESQKNGTLVGG